MFKVNLLNKRLTCLAIIGISALNASTAFATINVACKSAGSVNQCTFSGQGSNLSSLINTTLNNNSGAVTLIFQTSNLLQPLTISNHNHVTFELAANVTLTAPAKGDKSWDKQSALISVSNANNFTLQGAGTNSIIDGKGASWWKAADSSRPYLFDVDKTTGLNLSDIQLVNSPMYHVHVTNSASIAISNMSITAPADSPNTDGINTHAIEHMTINNITVNNGDDGIAVNSNGGASDDIQISNVTLINGHGLSIGSQVYNPITNMHVSDVVISDATYGLRIKTRCPNNDCSKTKAGSVSNISYQNITLKNVGFPLYFDLNYSTSSYSNVKLSNITFTNISSTHSNHPASLICAKTNGCTGLVFNNLNIDRGGECQGINGGSYSKTVPCSF